MPDFPLIRTVAHCFRTISLVVVDLVRLAFFAAHSRRALAAENLLSIANNASEPKTCRARRLQARPGMTCDIADDHVTTLHAGWLT